MASSAVDTPSTPRCDGSETSNAAAPGTPPTATSSMTMPDTEQHVGQHLLGGVDDRRARSGGADGLCARGLVPPPCQPPRERLLQSRATMQTIMAPATTSEIEGTSRPALADDAEEILRGARLSDPPKRMSPSAKAASSTPRPRPPPSPRSAMASAAPPVAIATSLPPADPPPPLARSLPAVGAHSKKVAIAASAALVLPPSHEPLAASSSAASSPTRAKDEARIRRGDRAALVAS